MSHEVTGRHAIAVVDTVSATAVAEVRNSGFGARGPVPPYFTQANVENFRKSGWPCPDAARWPQWWWSLYGNAGTVEFPRTGGVQADGYAKLAGTGVYLAGYHGLKLPSTPARDLIVKEEAALYGSGALIEDKEVVKADDVFAQRRQAYRDALAAFAQAKGTLDRVLVESLEAELKTLGQKRLRKR